MLFGPLLNPVSLKLCTPVSLPNSSLALPSLRGYLGLLLQKCALGNASTAERNPPLLPLYFLPTVHYEITFPQLSSTQKHPSFIPSLTHPLNSGHLSNLFENHLPPSPLSFLTTPLLSQILTRHNASTPFSHHVSTPLPLPHHLHLNSSKSKLMFFSRKPVSHFDHFPTLSISHSPLDRVSSFRYLGVLLTPSLSWSNHIVTICSKARKLLGLIFRHFYSHSSPSTLIKLYISLVRPHLEYCSLIWDPSSPTLIQSLESVQLFALKLASKFRPFLIPSLKSQFNLPTLASRRSYFKLIFLFKLSHELLHFPSPILQFNPTLPYPIRSFHPNNFLCPPSKTSSFQNSFFPSAISLWNTLPPAPKETQSL